MTLVRVTAMAVAARAIYRGGKAQELGGGSGRGGAASGRRRAQRRRHGGRRIQPTCSTENTNCQQ